MGNWRFWRFINSGSIGTCSNVSIALAAQRMPVVAMGPQQSWGDEILTINLLMQQGVEVAVLRQLMHQEQKPSQARRHHRRFGRFSLKASEIVGLTD